MKDSRGDAEKDEPVGGLEIEGGRGGGGLHTGDEKSVCALSSMPCGCVC